MNFLSKILSKKIFSIFKNRELNYKNFYVKFYDEYHKRLKKQFSSFGVKYVEDVCREFSFESVLDAGCGDGEAIREFLKKGYNAVGIELSGYKIREGCKDLKRKGIIFQASLDNIPFKDNSFDLVFSTEVLEHIPEEKIEKTIKEIIRVARRYIFLTISLRPSMDNNKYHITLKPRDWWENKFIKNGATIMHDKLNKFQKRCEGATTRDIILLSSAKPIINEMEWFIDNPKYDLKGELEPWFFIFEKNVR